MKNLLLALVAALTLTATVEAAGRRSVMRARSSSTTTTRGIHTQPQSVKQFSQAYLQTGQAFGEDALYEVNADRIAWGLPPLIHDPMLTIAAQQCASIRARNLTEGHLSNEYAYLPPGSWADATGCGALAPSWGWGTCCTDERQYRYAGAAVVTGRDGRRYMHLFVRR